MTLETLLPWLPVPAVAAFAVLALAPVTLSHAQVRVLGVAGGAGCALLAAPFVAACIGGRCRFGGVEIGLGRDVGPLEIPVSVMLSPVGVVAAGVLTGIAALVLLYASRYMAGLGTAVLRRFFALMNLFLAGMLTLVIAADAVVLFLGWELIGLCSFFLISFDGHAKAVRAGRTAFIATRIADAALLTGLLLLFHGTGTVALDAMLRAAAEAPDAEVTLAAALIVAGALGKSAQLPFQVWLPKAMAGPTPVSALLHSATMVAAGVVLLARFSPLLTAAPGVSLGLAVAGLAGALMAGLAALVQRDIKELLAYSTISQLGYMMLAIGVGAPGAAMAHFAMHAAFKALLFLSAGVLTEAAGHSRRLADLRGAARVCPGAFAAFAVGASGLAGLPFVAAGWYSKETVLNSVLASGVVGGEALWAAGLAGAVITAAYALRPVVLLATGKGALEADRAPRGPGIALPLGLLAAATLAGGVAVEGIAGLRDPALPHPDPAVARLGLAAPLAGAALGVLLAVIGRRADRTGLARLMRRGFGFDALYERRLAGPFRRAARGMAHDPVGDWLTGAARGVFGPADPGEGRGLFRLPLRPVRVAPLAVTTRTPPSLLRRLRPDRIDRLLEAAARALLRAAEAAGAGQARRPRGHATMFGIGLVALLLLVLLSEGPWH